MTSILETFDDEVKSIPNMLEDFSITLSELHQDMKIAQQKTFEHPYLLEVSIEVGLIALVTMMLVILTLVL